ncbi:MAG: hypothetical protein KDA24_21855 [Deltaproteobacteria bacterium]|nr:hypothetical protein [Deltaproteobacteria bacterium]
MLLAQVACAPVDTPEQLEGELRTTRSTVQSFDGTYVGSETVRSYVYDQAWHISPSSWEARSGGEVNAASRSAVGPLGLAVRTAGWSGPGVFWRRSIEYDAESALVARAWGYLDDLFEVPDPRLSNETSYRWSETEVLPGLTRTDFAPGTGETTRVVDLVVYPPTGRPARDGATPFLLVNSERRFDAGGAVSYEATLDWDEGGLPVRLASVQTGATTDGARVQSDRFYLWVEHPLGGRPIAYVRSRYPDSDGLVELDCEVEWTADQRSLLCPEEVSIVDELELIAPREP